MKKQLAIVLAALFAVVFIFGCTGGKKEEEKTGTGYALTVKPDKVIAGGVITVDLRLKNIFEKDMENVVASISGIPKRGFSGAEDDADVGTIVSGQEFPAIWTINTPDTEIQQTITPTVEVCFDYVTDFFFDTAVRPKALAAEEVSLQSSYSDGPVSISQLGLENLFVKDSGDTTVAGSLNVNNNWQGNIKKFNKVELINPVQGIIKSAAIGYAKCGGSATSITPSGTDCGILENELAIGEGITAKISLTLGSGLDEIEIDRIDGKVSYTYCYDIPAGTITVCPVGQRC